MSSRSTSFFLQLIALWVTVFALATMTAVAFIASTHCANCQAAFGSQDSTSHIGFFVTDRDSALTIYERISTVVYEHSSYFQSIHITLFQAVATFCLTISAPSLWAMIWSRLDHSANTTKKPMTVTLLQNGIDLAQSSRLEPAFFYATKSRTLPHPVLFVVTVAIVSRFAPLAISPIYKPHNGPYLVNASVTVGGGVGISDYSLSYDPDLIVPGGLEAGRALLSARSYLKTDIAPAVYDISVAPFLFQDTIQAIWNAEIKTAVARNTLDCGPSSPLRIWNISDSNTTQGMVVLDPSYFGTGLSHDLSVSIAGHDFNGQLTNEPLTTPTYLNTILTNATGSVTAITSVVFLAANGTLEGSQQKITAPSSNSWIASVDVLVCTSNTTLEVNNCTIDRGRLQSCSASNTDDLDKYIAHPNAVATILAASPVTAYTQGGELLPIYAINQDIISSQLPFLPYLTDLVLIPSYFIPLNYTQNVLFGQTAQGIVQGFVNAFPQQQPQNIQVTVTFATSQPLLLSIIMTFATACALAATILNVPRRAVPALDTARLLATPRDSELTTMLEPYGNRNERIGKEVLNASVVCKHEGGRHVLALDIMTTEESTVSSSGSKTTLLLGEDYELGQAHSNITPLLGQ